MSHKNSAQNAEFTKKNTFKKIISLKKKSQKRTKKGEIFFTR